MTKPTGRPNGRPKGSKNRATIAREIRKRMAPGGADPLTYEISAMKYYWSRITDIMNKYRVTKAETAEVERLWSLGHEHAKVCLPFLHARPRPVERAPIAETLVEGKISVGDDDPMLQVALRLGQSPMPGMAVSGKATENGKAEKSTQFIDITPEDGDGKRPN